MLATSDFLVWVFAAILAIQLSALSAFEFLTIRWSNRRPPTTGMTNYKPAVAVVIPCYNEETTIERKLMDVYENCSYNRDLMRVYVIDDHSEDDTYGVATSFKTERHLDSLFVWRNESREGKASALNWALRKIDDEILAITDADTLWSFTALEDLVHDLGDPTVGAVTAKLVVANPENSFGPEPMYRDRFDQWMRAESNIDSCSGFNGQLMVFKRHIIDNLRINERTYADDVDLLFKVRRLGYRVIYEPRATIREFVPTSYVELFKQKVRRSRGITQVLLGNLTVLARYGRFGQVIYPLRIYAHVISPLLTVVLLALFPVVVARFPVLILSLALLCIPSIRFIVTGYLVNELALVFGLATPRRGRWRTLRSPL